VAELVGVRGDLLFGGFDSRELLLFDRIAVFGVDLFSSLGGAENVPESDVASIEWLREQGVLFDPTDIPVDVSRASVRAGGRGPVIGRQFFAAANNAIADQLTSEMRKQGIHAVPIVHDLFDVSRSADRSADPTTVVRLVIEHLPLPSESVAFQDVLEFRAEASKNGLPQELRVWMNEVAAAKLTPFEIEDKLDALMHRYQIALKAHRMDVALGRVEMVLLPIGDAIEELLRFRWGTMARKLFELKRLQTRRMFVDPQNLPGREVAYIVKARERFGC
jgi:hypothetical protein